VSEHRAAARTQGTRLAGRAALVTGAARGIGAATAERLAVEGADVCVVDLDEADAVATAKHIAEQTGRRALGVGADVTDSAATAAAVDRAVAELGRLDILVNNAGITRDNLLFKMSDDDWDQVISVHLRGMFLATRAAQRHMVEQRWGRIVNLSSVSALGTRGQLNYSAAKAGVQGATRTLAIELGPFGVTANAVAPGFVVTEMTEQLVQRLGTTLEAFSEERAKITPVRRAGRPADIAGVIAFLAGDDAEFITGQTIYVDGGRRL
jgi:3-oxoacyl-[acyl-carrier protein] reductase